MKGRFTGIVSIVVVLGLLVAGVAFAGIQDRIQDQQHRIDQGIATGKLTRAEADVVQDNLDWVKIRFARLTRDGRLTQGEVRSLDRMLDENDALIYKKKRNFRRIYEASFQERINDQQRRIDTGIRSGRLTRAEANIVQDNLNWIKSRLSKFKRDGNMSRGEWERLDQMLDQNSYMIHKEKNDQVRRIY